jgi:uncharacterized SAM-binding protein YcdF (DUF218 family)
MRRAVRLVLLGLGACVAVYVARQPVLTAVGSFLVEKGPLRPADAIVVLGGSRPDRILEAIDLYQAGWAPRLVLTRGKPSAGIEALRARGGHMAEPHEVNVSIALQLGVPAQAVVVVSRASESTATEAEAVIRYVLQKEWQRVIVVTSKLHTRRAGWIYRTLAAGSVEVVMRPSRYDAFDSAQWWQSRTFTRRVVIEYQKLVVFAFRDSWRSRSLDGDVAVETVSAHGWPGEPKAADGGAGD